MTSFAHKLVQWYRTEKRTLPWRLNRDPYRILVSETMLQQTRVETVIAYFNRFMEALPTIHDLARADETEVLKLWQGLGYYSRAKNLHATAKVVVRDYGGQIPTSVEQVSKLPGVGPYTTGAVLSIAYNLPVPAVDGNVLRVCARYLGIESPIDKALAKREITTAMQAFIDTVEPTEFTQAVMELGATVCTPRSPSCLTCPVAKDCSANNSGTTDVLPVKSPKKSRKRVRVASLWLENDGMVLVQKRKDSGLLAGLFQLPQVEWPEGSEEAGKDQALLLLGQFTDTVTWNLVRESAGHEEVLVPLAHEKHIFSHIEWEVEVFRPVGMHLAKFGIPYAMGNEFQFVRKENLHELVWPRVYEKLLEEILGERVR